MNLQTKCLVLGVVLWSPTSQADDLRLIVDYALRHGPKLSQALAQKELASIQKEQASAQFWPSLEAQAGSKVGATYQKTANEYTPPQRENLLSLKATQPIWDGGIRSLDEDIAEAAEGVEALRFQEARDHLILEVILAYIRYSEVDVRLQSETEKLHTANRYLADAETSYKQGLRTKLEYQRVLADAKRAQFATTEAQNSLTEAKLALKALIGLRLEDEATLIFKPLTVGLSVDDTEVAMPPLDKLPVMKRLAAERAQRKIIVQRETHRNTWPTLNLTADAGYTVQESSKIQDPRWTDLQAASWSVGLNLVYPLWDAGSRSRNIQMALVREKIDNANSDDEATQLNAKVATTLRELKQSKANFKLATDLLKFDADSFVMLEREYKQGRLSYFELLDQTDKLQQSRLAVAQAYFQWQKSAWTLRNLEGTIYESATTK